MKDRFISLMPTSSIKLKEIILDSKENLKLVKIDENIWVDSTNGELIVIENLHKYSENEKNEAEELEVKINGKYVMVILRDLYAENNNRYRYGAIIIGVVDDIIDDYELVTSIKFSAITYQSRMDTSVTLKDNRLYLNSSVLGIVELDEKEYSNILRNYSIKKSSLIDDRVKFNN